ncbi:MAG: hypothetical protein J6T53_07195 [Bacteroidales bacterium]|nr:hypothetical protein [Bacteroidales bacterium]
MKKINLLLGIALISLLVASCGSSKEVAQKPQNQPADLPCPDCTASKGNFKYLAQTLAESEYDIQSARIFAEQNARDGIQAMIESVVQRSVDQFTQQHRDGDNVKNIAKGTIQSIGVVKGKLKNTPVTCWDAQPSKLTPGKIAVYVCIEYSGEDVLNTVVETMSADTELKIDFKQEQYKNDFYKALEEYGNN